MSLLLAPPAGSVWDDATLVQSSTSFSSAVCCCVAEGVVFYIVPHQTIWGRCVRDSGTNFSLLPRCQRVRNKYCSVWLEKWPSIFWANVSILSVLAGVLHDSVSETQSQGETREEAREQGERASSSTPRTTRSAEKPPKIYVYLIYCLHSCVGLCGYFNFLFVFKRGFFAFLKDVFLLKNSSVLFHSWKIALWFPQLIASIYNSRSAAALARRQESAGIDWMDFFHRSAHAAVKSAERKGLERQRRSARLTANVLNRYRARASALQQTQQTNSDSGASLRCSSGDKKSRVDSLTHIWMERTPNKTAVSLHLTG